MADRVRGEILQDCPALKENGGETRDCGQCNYEGICSQLGAIAAELNSMKDNLMQEVTEFQNKLYKEGSIK